MGMSPRCYPTNTWLQSLDKKKGPNLRWSLIQCSGGDEGDRTPDLLTASQALSQLSYAPVTGSYYRGMFLVVQEVFWVGLLTYGIFGTGPKISPWPSASAQF